ncbi:glutamate-1-semialdehyde 2,1-aminomutase [Serinibacter arcticus]|uniref:Glutamate-1-semialdehyde 2,1-aminomutase n=1 Tax=Serinibacter arcticus TaxID=1655435 RepID=A0A4Z1DYH0_9MICO|nr:glutamate-1-semialdehyde 2,1-aminomutase [Serinibacter arcticus]TGO04644.1 Glutamate-1-semialdehyde aminotransferase [Serinibacter arcticus]
MAALTDPSSNPGTTPATTNEAEFDASRAVIPGGVNSPVRAYGSVGGTPRFYASASGPHVTDVTGRRYVDLVCSWGPALLGHAHPEVVAAVQEAATRGLSFGAPTHGETELAETVLSRLEVDGRRAIERLRLVSTGTEATMTAIRLARGATDRPLIIKFAGHYHGHSDGLLAEAGSGVATQGLPGSAGIPADVAAQTLVLPYNDLDAIDAAFAAHPGRIAAIITEAAGANAGVLRPDPGLNAALAARAHAHGALLILDEVLTGFRVGPAGWWGREAAGLEGGPSGGSTGSTWTPDLVAFGKVIGGGMPLAAIGGRRDVMELLAPLGPVYQAGTLSGNPLAVAAGLATLRLADEAVYRRVDEASAAVSDGVAAAFSELGHPVTISRAGSLFSLAFRDGAVRDYDDAKAQEGWRYRAFFASMLGQGVALPPSVYEAWFLSAAHDEAAVDQILAALPVAARAAVEATPPPHHP